MCEGAHQRGVLVVVARRTRATMDPRMEDEDPRIKDEDDAGTSGRDEERRNEAVEILNDAKLSANPQEKVAKLRQLTELVCFANRDLLEEFVPEICEFLVDANAQVSSWRAQPPRAEHPLADLGRLRDRAHSRSRRRSIRS